MTATPGRRAWCVGADIDTDQLAPGATMKFDIAVTARYCLQAVRPDFAPGVRPGDVLVAGANFGIGSSREQAVASLLHLGVAAVIAPSFGGLFFRNACNLGLLLLSCAEAGQIADGAALEFDARAGWVRQADGRQWSVEPMSDFLLDMVAAGGLLPQLEQQLQRQRQAPRASNFKQESP